MTFFGFLFLHVPQCLVPFHLHEASAGQLQPSTHLKPSLRGLPPPMLRLLRSRMCCCRNHTVGGLLSGLAAADRTKAIGQPSGLPRSHCKATGSLLRSRCFQPSQHAERMPGPRLSRILSTSDNIRSFATTCARVSTRICESGAEPAWRLRQIRATHHITYGPVRGADGTRASSRAVSRCTAQLIG